MNLLAKAKFSIRGGFLPFRSIAVLQHWSLYCTKTAPCSSITQRVAENLGVQKTSDSSLPPTFKERRGPAIDWPRPLEIPFQPRVANAVNLIGHVKTPVHLESGADGNRVASVLIFQDCGGGLDTLLIPVVFEGDLAQVVALHVKEKDRVFVSGKLRMGPTRFVFADGYGKFHLVAENLNFVEGYAKKAVSSAKIEKPLVGKAEEVVQIEKTLDGNTEGVVKQVDWNEALERFNAKRVSGESNWWVSSPVTQQSNNEVNDLNRIESKPEKGYEKILPSSSTKKNEDPSLDLWRDLLKSPKQWWDYRGHKSNGLVKERHPDFKHKDSGNGLWVDRAPDWVLPGLTKLEFDIKFLRTRLSQGGEGEDSWTNLVENPNKWWDYRLRKKNPRSPDFKHKETGEGLWLNDMPEWALSRLPQSKAKGSEGVGETKEFEVKFVTENRVQGAKGDDSWRDLVENPNKWWDNRLEKHNPRSADFKHKETGERLWLRDMPEWALSRLPQSRFRQSKAEGGEGVDQTKEFEATFVTENRVQGAKGDDSWRNLVENPNKWWDNRLGKKNPRSPDFKHKETGEGLWLRDMPEWALSRVPQSRFHQSKAEGGEGVGQTKEFEAKFVTANRVEGAKGEDSWKDLVENPYKWWDNRLGKKNPRSPDFKHKETGEGLWLRDMPEWALLRLPQSKDGKKSMQAPESV
ncbi:Protein OSB3- chloroplastic/mitochondrial [Striga hermonthica]|uniref:Protein OSB3- chloroplastic/mitochondrial n=1 Tax=Striga hermonthica TaxID=68872 RepID=A0A9N7P3L1_STRHE|nr:Protein OSB3- chloroplastic/mitochondrial [Striga hermonthica]